MPKQKINPDNLRIANLIERELKYLGSNYPNTRKRANTVITYLKGERNQKELANLLGVGQPSISNWVKICRGEQGIKGLKKFENTTIAIRRDDRSHSDQLAAEIPMLGCNYPNTKKRANAVLSYLMQQGTREEIARPLGVAGVSVSTWANVYRTQGIDGLKRSENTPLSVKKADTSKDRYFFHTLSKEIPELGNTFPNTLKRANAVSAYLNGELTQQEIAESLGVSQTSITNWARTYRQDGLKGLMQFENRPIITKEMNEVHSIKLKKEISGLENTFPNTLKRANAVMEFLAGKRTQKDMAATLGIANERISSWTNTYRNGGIEELKKMENRNLPYQMMEELPHA